jgi:hypothetical protein
MKIKVMIENTQTAIRYRKHIVLIGDDYVLVYENHDDYLKNVFNDLKLNGYKNIKFKNGDLLATKVTL